MNTYTIEGLKHDIEESKKDLKRHNESIDRYNKIIDNSNKVLTDYMKQQNFDNATIGRYTSIKSILDLTFIQKEIKDISTLKHVIEKISNQNFLNSNLELKRLTQDYINKKAEQLKELKEYGRVFSWK